MTDPPRYPRPEPDFHDAEMFDTEPHLIDHPVFEEARDIQRLLGVNTFTTKAEAEAYMLPINSRLNKAVYEQSLVGQPARLSAPNLYMPAQFSNLANGTIFWGEKIETSDWLHVPVKAGYFAGFEPVYFGIDTGGESAETLTMDIPGKQTPCGVRVELHYQVQVVDEPVSTPGMLAGYPAAHASVADASIEFHEDRRRQDAQAALDVLQTLETPEGLVFTHNLNALVPPDTYDHRRLRSVGRIIRTFLTNEEKLVTEQHRDAVLDLLRARLNLYPGSIISVALDSSIGLKRQDNKEYPYLIYGQSEGQSVVNDLLFVPYYYGSAIRQGKGKPPVMNYLMRGDKENSPAICGTTKSSLKAESRIINMPFEKVRSLGLESMRQSGIS